MHDGSAALRPRSLASATMAALREVLAFPDALRPRPPGRRVAFLPGGPATDAAHALRVHAIADALPALGWQAAVLPWKLPPASRRRLLGLVRPDVVVMKGLRHPSNRPEFYPGAPILLDLDDADFHLAHLACAMTTAMPRLAGVVAGSRYVADWCRAHGAPRADVVWTGATPSPRPAPPNGARGPVVAWAQTRPMTYAAEAAEVRAAMARVAARHPGVRLRLHDRRPGDDPEFARSFAVPGLTVEWVPAMSYAGFLASLDDVAVGLAPLDPATPFSRGKSFGKVLAYLDRDVAVVATRTGEQGQVFDVRTAHLTEGADAMAAAVTALLDRPTARAAMVARAGALFRERLSVDASAQGMARVLDAAAHGQEGISAEIGSRTVPELRRRLGSRVLRQKT